MKAIYERMLTFNKIAKSRRGDKWHKDVQAYNAEMKLGNFSISNKIRLFLFNL